MTEITATAFPEAPAGHPHDLLSRLYREIGISAVAAALNAIETSDAPSAEIAMLEDHRLPPMLRKENLAA
jgi:hypothetical protein